MWTGALGHMALSQECVEGMSGVHMALGSRARPARRRKTWAENRGGVEILAEDPPLGEPETTVRTEGARPRLLGFLCMLNFGIKGKLWVSKVQ